MMNPVKIHFFFSYESNWIFPSGAHVVEFRVKRLSRDEYGNDVPFNGTFSDLTLVLALPVESSRTKDDVQWVLHSSMKDSQVWPVELVSQFINIKKSKFSL
jgi:hypothetical protein